MKCAMKSCRLWLTLLLLVACTTGVLAQDYNPTNPPEPMARSTVTVSAEPAEAAYVSGGGKYAVGQQVSISTSTRNSNYEFLYWMKDGVRTNDPRSFKFTMGNDRVNFVAVYGFNPANPQEPTMPNTYRLYLDTDAEGACTFNIASGQKQKAGQYVRVTAQNITPGFVFKGWFVDGQKVSSNTSFNYLMPYSDVTLLASLVYDPANPGEPDSDNEQESIDNGRPGDVNNDGKVNVTDIMAVANHILNITMTVFNARAADVNNDGKVNVTDIMGIANIILGVNTTGNSRATSEVDAVEPQ